MVRLNAFNRMNNVPSTSTISNDAVLKIGDIQIAKNNLAEARKEFDRLSKSSLVMYQDQAAFKLAELYYFEAKFDSALTLLKRFTYESQYGLDERCVTTAIFHSGK